ncbi:MAG: RecX family transcriptional regulator [Pseudomonadota bacterium]
MVSPDSKSSSPGSAISRRGKRESKARKTRPLDETGLRDLALSYAARYATTGAKLEAYLRRKLRERGAVEDDDGRTVELDVTGLVTRLIELGYVDDDAYARMRSRDLTARGYGPRRVEQALWAAGIKEQVREDHALSEAASRRAAIVLAKKRRFGPFGDPRAPDDDHNELKPTLDQATRDKQIAAMIRAGHDFEHVRFIMDASHLQEVADWLSEAEADEASGEEEFG